MAFPPKHPGDRRNSRPRSAAPGKPARGGKADHTRIMHKSDAAAQEARAARASAPGERKRLSPVAPRSADERSAERNERRPGADRGERRPGADRGERRPGADRGERRVGTDRGERRAGADRGERRPGADRGERRPGPDRGERRPYGRGTGERAPLRGEGGDRPARFERGRPGERSAGRPSGRNAGRAGAEPAALPARRITTAPLPIRSEPRADGREGERVAKLLARAGIASRREVERLIAEGRVKQGDALITEPSTLLTSLKDITVDGRQVAQPEIAQLYAFHKPDGLITAERDPAGRPTIYIALRNTLPPGTPRLMPIGRLDLNTEGLLLLTNDGELKRAMELPSSLVPRTYRARTFGDITQARLEELIEGVEVDGVRYGKIDANMERRTGRNQWIELTLTEGKNREVRRVLEHLGLQVSRLLRTKYGPFELLDLPRGQAIQIPQPMVDRFRSTLKTGAPKPAPKNSEGKA